MTAARFRRLALGMAGAIEASHMGHPDFRAGGRIFASLHDGATGVVKLRPDQQQRFLEEAEGVFTPAAGAWGAQGWTRIALGNADEELVGEAMTFAWQNVTAQKPKKRRKT